MSADICWSVLRKNSRFIVKSLGKTLTTEPNNLTHINSFRYNGYIQNKTVGIDADASGKGVVMTLRKTSKKNCPSKATTTTTLKGSRHAIKAIRNTLKGGCYRKDLSSVAVRRTSAILRSQTTSTMKKRRSRRKKN